MVDKRLNFDEHLKSSKRAIQKVSALLWISSLINFEQKYLNQKYKNLSVQL